MGGFVLPIIDGARNFGGLSPREAAGGSLSARVAGVVPPPETTVAADAAPAIARIAQNQLIADCPEGCAVAAFVWRDGPQVFLCPQCFNGALGGRWRAVALPPDLPAIEAALLRRSLPQTRNWASPETVADLLRENAEHLSEG